MAIQAKAAKVQAIQMVSKLSECKITALSSIALLIFVQGSKFDSVSFQAGLCAEGKGTVSADLAKRLTNNSAKMVSVMNAEIAKAISSSANEKDALADIVAMLKAAGLTTQKALEGKLFPNRGKGTGVGGRPSTKPNTPPAGDNSTPPAGDNSAPAPSKTPLETACDLADTLSNDDLLKLAAKVQALMTVKGMLVTTSPKRPAAKKVA